MPKETITVGHGDIVPQLKKVIGSFTIFDRDDSSDPNKLTLDQVHALGMLSNFLRENPIIPDIDETYLRIITKDAKNQHVPEALIDDVILANFKTPQDRLEYVNRRYLDYFSGDDINKLIQFPTFLMVSWSYGILPNQSLSEEMQLTAY